MLSLKKLQLRRAGLCSTFMPLCMGSLKHLDRHLTDRYTGKQSWHCVLCVEVCSAVCAQTGTLKDNYILFPSIKLNCPNNGMAGSQQYCCVLLQTIIELTVHFFSGGWNIKFDLVLVLMLLHFASLTVFLDDRGICDHSTMTWEPQLWQEIALVMGLEHVLQNITQCKSGKMGQTECRPMSDRWLWIHGVTENAVVWNAFPAIFQSKSCLFWTSDEFLTRGKHNTDNENYNMCLFSALLNLKLVIIFKPLQPLVFSFFSPSFYSGKHTVHMVLSPCFQEHAQL